ETENARVRKPDKRAPSREKERARMPSALPKWRRTQRLKSIRRPRATLNTPRAKRARNKQVGAGRHRKIITNRCDRQPMSGGFGKRDRQQRSTAGEDNP